MGPPARITSGDDTSVLSSLVGVSGEGLVGLKMLVTLDGKAERAAQGAELGHADESQFGESDSEIAKTEGDVVAAELGEEPGALGIGCEELDDGLEVQVGQRVVHALDLSVAVGEQLFGLWLSEECH
jgi:hypothetical protein